MVTLDEILRRAAAKLAAHGVAEPLREARLIWSEVTGCSPARQLAAPDQTVGSDQTEQFTAWIERRCARVPFAYLCGRQNFCGYDFAVENCLIPRPETELAVEWLVARAPAWFAAAGKCRILDLCTGTGCLGLALALELELKCDLTVELTATDLSAEALQTARGNAERLGVRQAKFVLTDLFPPEAETFDLIVSNPPYVTVADYSKLEPEIRFHEPQMALVGGEDGLDFYRRILISLEPFLRRADYSESETEPAAKAGSVILLEHGQGQRDMIRELARKHLAPLREEFLIDDWQGIDRFYACRV